RPFSRKAVTVRRRRMERRTSTSGASMRSTVTPLAPNMRGSAVDNAGSSGAGTPAEDETAHHRLNCSCFGTLPQQGASPQFTAGIVGNNGASSTSHAPPVHNQRRALHRSSTALSTAVEQNTPVLLAAARCLPYVDWHVEGADSSECSSLHPS